MTGADRPVLVLRDSLDLDYLQGSLIEAPDAIALLGQVMLLSTQKGFSLISKPNPKSTQAVSAMYNNRAAFRYITHPESFRATLLQVRSAVYGAFLSVHSNMHQIKLSCEYMEEHLNIISECIREGDNDDIKLIQAVVPISLNSMLKSAENCASWGSKMRGEFRAALVLQHEVIDSLLIIQMTNKERVIELIRSKQELEWDNMQNENEIRRQTVQSDMNKLSEKISLRLEQIYCNKVEKLELDEIQEIITDAIKQLSELYKRWTVLEMLFEQVANVLRVAMSDASIHFSEQTRMLLNHNSLTKFAKKKLIQLSYKAYTHCYTVSSVSTSYLKISDKFLLPSVIELGSLLGLDSVTGNRQIWKKAIEIQTRSKDALLYILVVIQSAKQDITDKMKALTPS